MSNAPNPKTRSFRSNWQRFIVQLGTAALLLLAVIVSCSQEPETVTVEVTRVVTETVVEESEAIEVTRVVTETIVEDAEITPEEESGEGQPSATGSEGDAEPLPPPPDNGPKVTESRGSTPAATLAAETAVMVRAGQSDGSPSGQPELIETNPAFSPVEWQKWCQLVTENYKKRCE